MTITYNNKDYKYADVSLDEHYLYALVAMIGYI